MKYLIRRGIRTGKAAARALLPARTWNELSYWKTASRASAMLNAGQGQVLGTMHHGLPTRLIVSLTSYPARYPTLDLTLRSIRRQIMPADAIVLWIARNDLARLPKRIVEMPGVTISPCDDIRSYKKLLFALERFPDDFIVTADDDVYYPPYWLRDLIEGWRTESLPTIAAHRVHRFGSDGKGGYRPYVEWERWVGDASSRERSSDLLPIGIGGVLYPPGSFPSEVFDRALFMNLAPHGDDLWFHWMTRRMGFLPKKVGPAEGSVTWRGTQDAALYNDNSAGRNDGQLRAMVAHFGLPGSG